MRSSGSYLEIDNDCGLGCVSVREAALQLALHELHLGVPVHAAARGHLLLLLLLLFGILLVAHLDDAEPLLQDVEVGEDLAVLEVNSIDIMNFGHETGHETGPRSGPTSVLGHYKFRHVSKLQK